jgi:hypothetical protein
MAKAKKGEYYSCSECGLVVVVDEACGCAAAEIVCCEEPMAKGKLAAGKAKKKATAKPAAPSKSTKPKAAPKKAPAKKAAKAAKK